MTTKKPSFTISYHELADAIAKLKPFANGVGVPILDGLHFLEVGGTLHVEATNRYTVCRVRTTSTAPAGLDFAVDCDALAGIVAAYRPKRGAESTIKVVVIEGERLGLSLESGTLASTITVLDVSAPLIEGAYPKLTQLIAKTAAAESTSPPRWLRGDWIRRIPAADYEVRYGKQVGFFTANLAIIIQPMVGFPGSTVAQRWTDAAEDVSA